MKNGFYGLAIAILLIVAVAGVGVYAYQTGVAQGMLDSGKLVAPTAPIAPYQGYPPVFFHRFGWGFGALGCLFPLLFFFLIMSLLRGFFWHGPWGWRHHMHRGHWGDSDAPPMFDEWHKRAHEPKSTNSG